MWFTVGFILGNLSGAVIAIKTTHWWLNRGHYLGPRHDLLSDPHFQHRVCAECLTPWETAGKLLEFHNPQCPLHLKIEG